MITKRPFQLVTTTKQHVGRLNATFEAVYGAITIAQYYTTWDMRRDMR